MLTDPDHTRDFERATHTMEEIGRVIRGERYASDEVLESLRLKTLQTLQRLSMPARLDILEDMVMHLLVMGARFARDSSPLVRSARESPTQPDATQPTEAPAHGAHPVHPGD